MNHAIHFRRFSALPLALAAVLAAVLAAALPGPARAEVIRSFDTTIFVHSDASFVVEETIGMDFEGAQRHGIFRMIPVQYNRGLRRDTISVDVQKVSDANGNPVQYKTSNEGAYLNIRLGSPDRLVTGYNVYRLRYTVRRAIRTFNGKPEVYWNVTGDKWPYPIMAASARFYPPAGVSVKNLKVDSFRGEEGSKVKAEVVRQADHILFKTRSLYPGEGMTIVAGLPAGSVTEPASEKAKRAMDDPLLAGLFPLLALGVMGRRWWNTGRDVDAGKPSAVEWDPPKNLSPAEVGTLVDEKCDMQDVLATVVDLAVRGYLRIEEVQGAKFLFFSSKDYIFTRQPTPEKDILLPHESEFLEGLFGSQGAGATVALSDLKNKFYTHLPKIRSAIYETLTKKGMFTSNPVKTRQTYVGVGLVIVALTIGSFFLGPEAISLRIGIIIAGLIVAAFAPAMPAKTAAGSEAKRESLGFQRFVRATEKDRIAVLAKDDPTIFGRLLPYAMVLGVADQWADAFRDLLREPPDWYSSPSYGYGHPFSTHAFVHDLGSGMNTMGSAFASAPSSSGGSGFSGGSSGGGFGGGGGGSW